MSVTLRYTCSFYTIPSLNSQIDKLVDQDGLLLMTHHYWVTSPLLLSHL